MKLKNIVAKLCLVVGALLLTLGGVGLLIPVRGEWVDWAASRLLTTNAGLEWRCANASIIRWSEIAFDRMVIGRDSENTLLEAGESEIRLGPPPFAVVSFKNVRFFQQILRDPLLSSLPIAKGLQGEFLIRQFSALWSGNRFCGTVHVLECLSKDFRLRGGAEWSGGQLTKAHFYFSLPPEKSKKIPYMILCRMIHAKDGWVSTRIIYSQDKLTLFGLRGPLFQAKWQGSSTLGASPH